jgi:hypothetical protein
MLDWSPAPNFNDRSVDFSQILSSKNDQILSSFDKK